MDGKGGSGDGWISPKGKVSSGGLSSGTTRSPQELDRGVSASLGSGSPPSELKISSQTSRWCSHCQRLQTLTASHREVRSDSRSCPHTSALPNVSPQLTRAIFNREQKTKRFPSAPSTSSPVWISAACELELLSCCRAVAWPRLCGPAEQGRHTPFCM